MTATILPRQYGVKLTCNRCGASVQSAMCGRKANRQWFAKQEGWGQGSDPGTRQTKGGENRPSTKAHDLCPKCLELDRKVAEERRKDRNERIATRDVRRKARDAGIALARKAAT